MKAERQNHDNLRGQLNALAVIHETPKGSSRRISLVPIIALVLAGVVLTLAGILLNFDWVMLVLGVLILLVAAIIALHNALVYEKVKRRLPCPRQCRIR